MAFAFNPITGKLDLVGSGGGGNPFDQSLNTGDSVNFTAVTTAIPDDNFSYITTSGVGGGNNNNGASWSFDSSGNGFVSGSFACSGITANGQSPSYLGVANTFTAGQTITAAANTSALTASYSVTGANTTPLLDLSGTWNTTGVARGILLNITDTTSAATSLFADFRVGGVIRFSVSKSGGMDAFSNSRFYSGSNAKIAAWVTPNPSVLGLASDTVVGWSSTANTNSTYDLGLWRDAANTLAQRNGTNAQTFRLYNTFTDASNYERGFMRWNNNTLEIGTEAGGTGTARDIRLVGAVNTILDCGSAGTTQLRTNGTTRINIGNSVVVSTLFRITSVGSLRLEGSATPASATATGTTGDIQRDANYIYVCTATNTWKRAELSTW
jgi:hypothetical protein